VISNSEVRERLTAGVLIAIQAAWLGAVCAGGDWVKNSGKRKTTRILFVMFLRSFHSYRLCRLSLLTDYRFVSLLLNSDSDTKYVCRAANVKLNGRGLGIYLFGKH